MSKVIRTARISEYRVILPLQLDADQVELLSSDAFAAQQEAIAREGEGFTPLDEGVEILDGEDNADEGDLIIEADPEPEPEPEFEPEPEPEPDPEPAPETASKPSPPETAPEPSPPEPADQADQAISIGEDGGVSIDGGEKLQW